MSKEFDLTSQEGLRERYNELTERYVEKTLKAGEALLDKAWEKDAKEAGISLEEVKMMHNIEYALKTQEPLESFVDDPKALNEAAEQKYLERLQASRSTDTKKLSFGKSTEERCAEHRLERAILDGNSVSVRNAEKKLAQVKAEQKAKEMDRKLKH